MNLALFDFDGTITYGDTFSVFVRDTVSPGRLVAGQVLLAPLIAGYKLGVVSGSLLRTSVTGFGFRGLREDDIRQAGVRYAREVLHGVVRPQALERIQWHKAQGDVVVVVSASLDMYLADWCRHHGLELICNELEAHDGVLTGRYRHGDCHSDEKARRILARYNVGNFPTVYAYGDTSEDRAMLELAHRKYFRWQEVD